MDQLTGLARALMRSDRRALLGIVGPPGSGKSTIAERIVADIGAPDAVAVPMDGYHLSNRVLDELGLRGRKGAIETFDGGGYRSLLARVRDPGASGETIFAPGFYRTFDEAIAASIRVMPETRLVVTEGNYLLDPSEPWSRLRPLFDAVWYIDLDDAVRRARLRARHESFGRSPADAADWVMLVDEPNAQRIAATRERADLVIAEDGSFAALSRPGRPG